MASLAQQLLQGAQSSAEKGLGVDEAVGSYLEVSNLMQRTEAQRMQLEQRKQQLKLQGANFVSGLVDKAKKMKGQQLNTYVNKWIPSALASAGLSNQYEVETIQAMARTPGGAAAMMIALNDLKAGKADSTIFSNPASIQEYMDSRGIDFPALGEMTPEDQQAYIDSFSEEISEAGSENVRAQAQQARLQATIEERSMAREERQEKQKSDKLSQISNRVRADFKPIIEDLRQVNNAGDALNRVVEGLNKGVDSSELKLDFNVASRGLGKAFNSGAMSEQDVADFRQLTGIKNITVDAINKWFTGGINPEAAKQLVPILKSAQKNLREDANAFEKSFMAEYDLPVFKGMSKEDYRKQIGIEPLLNRFQPKDKGKAKDVAPNVEQFKFLKSEAEYDKLVSKFIAGKQQFEKAGKKFTLEDVVAGLKKQYPNAKLTELNKLGKLIMESK